MDLKQDEEEEKKLLNEEVIEEVKQTTYKPLFQIYDLRMMNYNPNIRGVFPPLENTSLETFDRGFRRLTGTYSHEIHGALVIPDFLLRVSIVKPFYDRHANDMLGQFTYDKSIGRIIAFDVTSRQSFDDMQILLRLNDFELTDPNLSKRYSRKIHVVGDLARMSKYDGLPARER